MTSQESAAHCGSDALPDTCASFCHSNLETVNIHICKNSSDGHSGYLRQLVSESFSVQMINRLITYLTSDLQHSAVFHSRSLSEVRAWNDVFLFRCVTGLGTQHIIQFLYDITCDSVSFN